jgi:hypothetical protein
VNDVLNKPIRFEWQTIAQFRGTTMSDSWQNPSEIGRKSWLGDEIEKFWTSLHRGEK